MNRYPVNANKKFEAFTIEANGILDSIISDIYIFQAYQAAELKGTDDIKPHATKALWDTGATGCVITKRLVDQIGLQPVDMATVSHAGGSEIVNTYYVDMILPNKVGVKCVPVNECKNIEGHFDFIVGMNIITAGDFSLTNVNNVSVFSFRIPSIKKIDYVREAKDNNAYLENMKFNNVGRNDPCPCGSGKKFKQCHGRAKR